LVASIDDSLRELADVEKRAIELAKSGHAGSYEHWTVLDTINHACSWKNNALRKVESRLQGEDVRYHSDKVLDDVNRHYYEKARDYSRSKTIEVAEAALEKSLNVLGKIRGKESSKDLAPIGYEGAVIEYLTFDLIHHPIAHYAYYAVRNDEYEVFLEIERFVSKRRSSVFSDLGVVSIKGFADKKTLDGILSKGYEWQHDELFIQIKSMVG